MTDPKLTAWLAKQTPDQRPIVDALFAAVSAAAPEATCAVKWGHPTWTQDGPVCQIKPTKKYVGLVFWWGARLADPTGALTGSGAKMRTARFPTVDAVDAAAVQALVAAGVRANQEHGDPTRTQA